MKTVRLRSGGYVRLECTVDPAVLSGDDRAIANVLTAMMDSYWFAVKRTR
jgi:hypothetical protein